MIQRQMIEVIKRHAPELSEEEIRDKMNMNSDAYCEETKILEGQWSFTTNPGQKFYDLAPDCVAVQEVNYDGKLSDKIMNVRNLLIDR